MASATLIALFLLSALTFYPPSTTAQFVTDLYGNMAENGGRFYILPSLIGALHGGIRLLQTNNESIPLSVVQSPFENDKGLPVTISSLTTPSTYLPEAPVSLTFEDPVGDLVWSAVEGFPEGTLVKVGGYTPIIGSFRIIKSKFGPNNSYSFLFCKGLQDIQDIIEGCDNVAIVKNDGNFLLVVSQDNPHVFRLDPYRPRSADA